MDFFSFVCFILFYFNVKQSRGARKVVTLVPQYSTLLIMTVANTQNQVVLFVARSSSGNRQERNDFLKSSLEWIKHSYEKCYGAITSDCRFFTFVHHSNRPLRPIGEVSMYFAQLRTELEMCNGRLVVILNGWDGLSTNNLSFVRLFSGWADRITLRVWSEESIYAPRRFFEVSVSEACKVFSGEE